MKTGKETFKLDQDGTFLKNEGSSARALVSALLASVLSACAVQTEEVLAVKTINEQTDTALADDSEDRVDTEDTGDTGGEDSAEPLDSADTADTSDGESSCEPHNTSEWAFAGTEVGAPFREAGGVELSGLTGIAGEKIYAVSDRGYLYKMDLNFVIEDDYMPTTLESLEGIAIDSSDGVGHGEIFVVDENDSDVDGYDSLGWVAGTDPVRTTTDCTLNQSADTAGNQGIEGFVFLPSSEAPATWADAEWADDRGYLLAGAQSSVDIGVYPIGQCQNDEVIDPVFSFPTSSTDISALTTVLGNLYVLHDTTNKIDVVNLGTLEVVETHELTTAGSEEAMWAIVEDCDPSTGSIQLAVGDDVSGEIWVYTEPMNVYR